MEIVTIPFITVFIRSGTFFLGCGIKDDIGTVHSYFEYFVSLNLFFKVNSLSFLDFFLCTFC